MKPSLVVSHIFSLSCGSEAGLPIMSTTRQMLVKMGSRPFLAMIDPRLKLLILSVFIAAALLCASPLSMAAFFVLAALMLVLSGQGKKTGGLAAVYALAFVAGVFLLPRSGSATAAAAGMLTHAVLRFLPLISMGMWFSGSTPISEWMAAMQALHLPGVLSLPLAVLLRFAPTVATEARCIRDAMRLRGIKTGLGACLRHPVQTLETLLVPLMMRSVRVADELSVAALTRAFQPGTARSALRPLHIGAKDVVITVVICFVLLGLLALDRGGVLTEVWA